MTQEILDTVHIGALATVNPDGTPLVTPLHFARMDDFIVWVSANDSRHSQNIARQERVEFVVWNDQKQAVFLNTIAREAEETDHKRCLDAYQQKLGAFFPKVDSARFYVAQIGKLDDNSTTENWLHYIA